MQQASRISDYTAFMYLGRLVEYGPTTDIFTNPLLNETERLRHGTVWLVCLARQPQEKQGEDEMMAKSCLLAGNQ